MAGGKNRKKIKEMFSPPHHASPPPPIDGENANAPDGDDLLDELMAQLEAKDDSTKTETAKVVQQVAQNQKEEVAEAAEAKQEQGKRMSSKDRFKARQARKAEAMAANYAPIDAAGDAKLEAEAKAEESAIRAVCFKNHLELWECPPDGNCMFTAIADQLRILGLLPAAQATAETTRRAAAQYMRAHPDDFMPFLPSVEGEDGTGATDDGLMSAAQFERYCNNIESTTQWGGQPELLALAKAFGVEIDVVQGGTPSVVRTKPSEDAKGLPVATISYHRRMYGLGEHYNSLRPVEKPSFNLLPHLHHGHGHDHSHGHHNHTGINT